MSTQKQIRAKITRKQNAIDKIIDALEENQAKRADILQRAKDGELSEYNARCMHSGLWFQDKDLNAKLEKARQQMRELQREAHAMINTEQAVIVQDDAQARQMLGLPPAKPADAVSMPKLLAFFEKLASEE